MKKPYKSNSKNSVSENHETKPDKNKVDIDADRSGTDKNSDKTKHINYEEEEHEEDKFEKPKRETNPDKTGIDTEADKTKPNIKTK